MRVDEDRGGLPRDAKGRAVASTFAKVEGVDPNYAAERALRYAVCRRKTNFGTESAAGSRFVERIQTSIESCRRQSRDLLGFLIEAVSAHRSSGTPPSLVSAEA
ncbi:hypothetical protein [Paludisphaera mucosa]|uniref:hypothetical protein n=1 Tax=Paludisphaera mucosa TaxID=3030827 RepID=UPI003F5F2107